MNYPEFEKFDLNKKEPSIATPHTINSAHSYTEGSEDRPYFKPEILRWLREDFVTIKELPDKFTINDIINCPEYISSHVWNDYCLPLQQRVKELESAFSNANDVYISDVNDYKNQITELREKVKQLEEKFKL